MATKFVTLTPSLFLWEQEVIKPEPQTPETATPSNVNHIWIADRSGSMSGLLRQLGEDIIERFKTLSTGDTVSFGWFSSEGEYRFVLKGFKVTGDPKDLEVFIKTIRGCMTTVGLTCFSEILADTSTVVSELRAFGDMFALMFMTDGYPVVSNYNKEVANIRTAIENLKGKISAAMLVGYGNYYNRELMTSMAEWFGGSLVHACDLKSFQMEFGQFVGNLSELEPRIEVTLENPTPFMGTAFSVQNRSVVYLEPQEGKILFTPYKGKKNFLYTLSETAPAGGKEVELTEATVTKGSTNEPLVKACYAAAMMLSQRCKVPEALDVLAKLGDVAPIDALNAAFTNDEFGRAEAVIAEAIAGPKSRFKGGRKLNYLPDPNAFCILDLLQLLSQDEQAQLWPRHEAFEYNRIGAKREKLEGTLKFEADPGIRCGLDGLVWNETMLNLSIRVKIPGFVELPGDEKELAKLGVVKNFPTFQWRNYTVIKDGYLNFTAMPVSVSKATFEELEKHGLVEGQTWEGEGKAPNIIDLSKVPVMNRRIGNQKITAVELCKMVARETLLSSAASAFNNRIKELEKAGFTPSEKSVLSPEALALLEQHGIKKDGSFSPAEGSTVKTGDYYEAKAFEISIKGAKTLPKVADVKAKVAALKAYDPTDKEQKAPKPLTPREVPVADALEKVASLFDPNPKIELAKLKAEVNQINGELFGIRRKMRELMFGMILGRFWFPEFTSREDNSLEVDGQTFLVSLRKVRVDL